MRRAPAPGGENARPADIIVLRQVLSGDRLLPDQGRQAVAHEGANLVAKGELVLGQSKVHGIASRMMSAPGTGREDLSRLTASVGPWPGVVNIFGDHEAPLLLSWSYFRGIFECEARQIAPWRFVDAEWKAFPRAHCPDHHRG